MRIKEKRKKRGVCFEVAMTTRENKIKQNKTNMDLEKNVLGEGRPPASHRAFLRVKWSPLKPPELPVG